MKDLIKLGVLIGFFGGIMLGVISLSGLVSGHTIMILGLPLGMVAATKSMQIAANQQKLDNNGGK